MTGYGNLPRRIRLGEDSALELKQISVAESRVIAPRRDDVANELGAFANGRGGDLVLGVDDTTREVAGIPLDALDAVEAWVRELCHDVLKPPLDATIRKIEFSDRAVFEALVNAVAHRDYSVAGARVRLHLFGDRLELYVPGALANTLTPESLHLRQANRNELIVSLLARCPAPTGIGRVHVMDRRGDGVPIIRRESRALSGCLPEYTLIDESELRLVIRAANAGV